MKQVNANTFTYELKSSTNKYDAIYRLAVAPDGKSMTVTGQGTDSNGRALTAKLVFEKQ